MREWNLMLKQINDKIKDEEKKLIKIEKEKKENDEIEKHLLLNKNEIPNFSIAILLLKEVLNETKINFGETNVNNKIELLKNLNTEINNRLNILVTANNNKIEINNLYEKDLINEILNTKDKNNINLKDIIVDKVKNFTNNTDNEVQNEA